MCDRITNRDTGQVLESVGDLCALVGRKLVETHEDRPLRDNCCLCNTDLIAIVTAAGYGWSLQNGDATDIVIFKTAQLPTN